MSHAAAPTSAQGQSVRIDWFSPDYFTARERFREASGRLGWESESHAIDARGPKGEELTVDVACSSVRGRLGLGKSSGAFVPSSQDGRSTNECSTNENSTKGRSPFGNTLVISSGLHGVEGFFGSAVQLGLMEQWAENAGAMAGLNVVLIHALNPFGFAWLRRCNEDNVDLNRNFLLAGEEFAGSGAGYAELNGLLNPPRAPSRWDLFLPRALWTILRQGGIHPLRQAVAGGQYDYPQGLFYGGKGPAQTQRILAEHLPRWIGDSKQVMHLDLHTGLGRWGQYKLLLDQSLSEGLRRRLDGAFGTKSWERGGSRGSAYRARGAIGNWCAQVLKGADYLYACAEFGTYGNIKVCAGLRAENQAHFWGQPEDAASRKAKEELKEVFCPTSEEWRRMVLAGGFRLVEQAVEYLGGRGAGGLPQTP